jgi:hypothetical protein
MSVSSQQACAPIAIAARAFEITVSSTEVYGEPNGRLALRRPGYTMETVSRDQNMVSRTKITFAFSLYP